MTSNLIRKIQGAIAFHLNKIKYFSVHGYNSKKYWNDRLTHYRLSLQGVGNKTLTEEENRRQYQKAGETFLSLCRKEGLDFRKLKILDIGCGIGFYAEIILRNGGENYTGVDITDTLFLQLGGKFSAFTFLKRDITQQPLPDTFDLIIMIDVTQHITTKKKFSSAMQNIKNHLNVGGTFIVTSWLRGDYKMGFYEVSRSLERYKREFEGFHFSEPMPFRGKFLFSIKNISKR
ncbi:TPA: class I SAM-dependent methyltransferase [Candidatus Woesearchaeota archaeon]|nr:class I SAM-dependent methyltransferase [Candidatus Woesearchaeota archaeon]